MRSVYKEYKNIKNEITTSLKSYRPIAVHFHSLVIQSHVNDSNQGPVIADGVADCVVV